MRLIPPIYKKGPQDSFFIEIPSASKKRAESLHAKNIFDADAPY